MSFDKNICSKLTQEQYDYLVALEQFTNSKIHFFGSITRDDYFVGKSDIDIYFITPNVHDTLFKVKKFINNPNQKAYHAKRHIKFTIDNLPQEHTTENLHIRQKNRIINLEINIYDEKYRQNLKLHYDLKRKRLTPFLVCCLIMAKSLYYNINLMHWSQMKEVKRFIMLCGIKEDYSRTELIDSI
jgi:predicted nucleotidyltransferase